MALSIYTVFHCEIAAVSNVRPMARYPMLHGMEKKGYLTSRHVQAGRRSRRVYEITRQGHIALTDARNRVKELFGELVEGK